MIDFRHVGILLRFAFIGALLVLLNACSQSPAPSAAKPLPVPEQFRSAQAPAPFIHPVPSGRISSSFANYIVKSRNRKHHGVDFAAPIGTPVFAASSGVVLSADMGSLSDAFGLAVLIEHGDKFQSLSAHLSRIDVNIGDWVQAGQQIGLVGKTGRATGAHLHFELWQNSIPKDPLLFLPIKAPRRAIAAEPLISTSLIVKSSEPSLKQSAAKTGSKKSTKTASTKKVSTKQSKTSRGAKAMAVKKAPTKNSKVATTKNSNSRQQGKKVTKAASTTAKTSKSATQLAKAPAKPKAKTKPTVTAEKPVSSVKVTDAKTSQSESGSSKPQPNN